MWRSTWHLHSRGTTIFLWFWPRPHIKLTNDLKSIPSISKKMTCRLVILTFIITRKFLLSLILNMLNYMSMNFPKDRDFSNSVLCFLTYTVTLDPKREHSEESWCVSNAWRETTGNTWKEWKEAKILWTLRKKEIIVFTLDSSWDTDPYVCVSFLSALDINV